MDQVQQDRVFAWIGDFASEADFNQYIEERYTEDGDSIPSGFMRDIGVDWFDHDFQEFVFHAPPIPIEEAMKNHSYSASFGRELAAAAKQKGCGQVRAVFLLYELDHEPSEPQPDAPIRFIGTFPFDPTARSLGEIERGQGNS